MRREWFQRTALADLRGAGLGLPESSNLYRSHNRHIAHMRAVFDYVVGRWRDMFDASFDVLLYDLVSVYLEADPRFPKADGQRMLATVSYGVSSCAAMQFPQAPAGTC